MAKEKYQLQYVIKSVPLDLLWNYISSDSCLEQWFADKVQHQDKIYSFCWDSDVEQSTLLSYRSHKWIRFRRHTDSAPYFWEFKITIDEVTANTILTVTDFAEPNEFDDDSNLWNMQIDKLKHCLGC